MEILLIHVCDFTEQTSAVSLIASLHQYIFTCFQHFVCKTETCSWSKLLLTSSLCDSHSDRLLLDCLLLDSALKQKVTEQAAAFLLIYLFERLMKREDNEVMI